ncbi:MAG: Uma2 family endonuclease [Pirellulales bacterium]
MQMMAASVDTLRCEPVEKPEPAWAIATLFPPQGGWNESAHLSFTESLGQMVELVDGSIEVPAMLTKTHQQVVHALLALLLEFLRANRAGDAVAAPYRMRLREATFREPDIVAYTADHLNRFGERFGEPADVVMEVVSDDAASRVRDYDDKRRDYAAAGVPEYWIVDPAVGQVIVLTLAADGYAVVGEHGLDGEASSLVLPGFTVGVGALLRR